MSTPDAKARMYPVLRGYGRTPDERDAWRRCRINVPWAMLAPHERRARLNHDQTLERLAERGGMSPFEIALVVTNQPLRFTGHPTVVDSVSTLERLVLEWEAANG